MQDLVYLSRADLDDAIRKAVEIVVARPASPYLNKKQLAARLEQSVSTINRLMKKGLPFEKDGKDYPEFYWPHVEAWLAWYFGDKQTIQGKADHPEGQELVQRNVVSLEKNRRAHHSQSAHRRANKRASGGRS